MKHAYVPMSVEDRILCGICEDCDRDPADCYNKDYCAYEEEIRDDN